MANMRVVLGSLATLGAVFLCSAPPAEAANDGTPVLVRRYTLPELDALATSRA